MKKSFFVVLCLIFIENSSFAEFIPSESENYCKSHFLKRTKKLKKRKNKKHKKKIAFSEKKLLTSSKI